MALLVGENTVTIRLCATGPDTETVVSTSAFPPGLAVAFSPDGQQLAIATLDGQISFWDVQTATQTGSVDGKTDLGGGRREGDMVTAKTSAAAK